ncbi:uncharacterized protein [Epargyreus clarus]|uniref:uncharacterized protein n=1 Tax=Epargyreus clarus TaxID=520877 RepID=UPI003C2AB43E
MARRKGGRRMGLKRLCILFWIVTCFNELQGAKIVNLAVPEIIQYGVQDTVILDCEYTLENITTGLMVKWFYETRYNLIYQWIASYPPQAIALLRNRVDLSYKASNDPKHMHRAIRIVKIDTDLTGNYTCVVSTFYAEDVKTKHMTVFAPETSFRLIQNKTDDDTVNVICAAEGAFPEPVLTLATPEKRLEGISHETELINGRYSAYASVTLQDADLPSPAEFICTLRIPLANYAVRKEAIYYPGPISTTPEIPTAADMQLAAAVGSRGVTFYNGVIMFTLSTLAQLIVF